MAVNAVGTRPNRYLPAQPNTLLGREALLAAASDTLLRGDCRLLTLIGPGGVGKTRFAIAVAEVLDDAFEDGVCFVDLTEVDDASSVPSLLAVHLGLQVENLSPIDRVAEYLQGRKFLLLLDNFEHVFAATSVVSLLTQVCPDLKVLVTSREPLQLRWERRMTVPPLLIPDPRREESIEELSAVPAVALFLQRARSLNMRFETTQETLREIAEICALLEGLPLAIELAAARTNVLSPAAILRRLEEMDPVLHQQVPDVPARHQSIAAALDWSYEILTDQEQATFRRLGVFSGGFTLEALESITNDVVGDVARLEILSSLVDKSLVVSASTRGGGSRYHLLEPIRVFAFEQLEREREIDAVEQVHAAFYLELTERASRNLRVGAFFVFSPDSVPAETLEPDWLPWPLALDAEQANLRTALRWARDHGPETLMRVAVALARYWWVRGALQEGAYWLDLALERNAEAPAALRSQALSGLGIMERQQGRFEESRAAFDQAVALSRTVGDSRLLSAHLTNLAGCLSSMSRPTEATSVLREATDLARAHEDAWGAAAGLALHGLLFLLLRRATEAEGALAQAGPLLRDIGDLRSVAIVEAARARAIALQGQSERALPMLEDALRTCRAIAQETLSAAVLEIAVYVAGGDGPVEEWGQVLGAAVALRERGFSRTTVERDIFDDGIAALRARIVEDLLVEALAQGRHLSGEEAIDRALDLVQSAPSSRDGESEPPNGEETGPFTQRQLEVLGLLALGCSNKEMGERLGISEQTAKYHVSWILNKLGAGNRAEAVSLALKRGLI